jgi:hypothetical protein
VNVSDAALSSNTAYPHPPLSANLLLSLTMQSTFTRSPGTVANLSHPGAVKDRVASHHSRSHEVAAVAAGTSVIG